MENKPLLDLLIGINEKGSTSLMNAQLEKVATKLMDLKVKMSLDGESTKEITSKIGKVAKEIAQMKSVDLSQDGLMKKFSSEIDTVLNKYKLMDATVTKVATTSSGAFNGMTVAVKDLENNLQTIHFNKDLVETSSSFVNKFQTNLKSMQVEIGNTQKALEKVKTTIASGKGSPELAAREVELTKQLNIEYGKLAVVVRNNKTIGDERKAQIIASIALSKQQSEVDLAAATNAGKSLKARADAESRLLSYKQKAAKLTTMQLEGKGDTKEAQQLEYHMSLLKKYAGVYNDISVAMDKVDVKEKNLFKSKSVKSQNKELDDMVKKLKQLSTALNTKQGNLITAEQTGNVKDVIRITQEIKNLKEQFDAAVIKGNELGNSLGRLDKVAEINKTEQEFKDVNQQILATADTVGLLERKFGKFLEKTTSGAGPDQLAKSFKDGAISSKQLTEAIFGTDAILKRTTSDSSKYQQMTKGIQVSVKDAEGVYRLWNVVLDENTNKFRLSGGAIDSMSHKVSGFGNQIMDAAKKIATWGISTKIVYGTWRAFLAGVEVVKELDKELTQIAIVSGQTRDSVKYLGEEYAATAVKMAQSVQEVAKLNTELVRQGLSIEEAAKRADTIMKLSAAGNITMEQSLQVITTGVNALGEAHTKVADVILKAANLSASDVEGLGEAFSKTASGAKAAGMSIEETTSLLATMKDITQEGDSQLGTSLKSMLARFNKINEETGEMNEDLNQVQTSIESVGVAFLDGEGQIRNVYDILQDLSGTWDTLDKNTKAYIATQAAGVRQQNRFFAVMDNFNQVQAMNNDLTSAAGTLQAAYGTYLDSTEAASVRLKATLDQLWIKFIDSDVISFIANVGSGLLGLLNSIGLIGTALVALATKKYFSVFLAQIGTVSKGLTEIAVKAANAGRFFATTAEKGVLISGEGVKTLSILQRMTISGEAFGTTAVSAFTATATAVKLLFIELWPLIAIAAVIGGIVWYTQKQKKEHAEKMKALAKERKAYEDMQASYYSNQASIETLGTKYIEYQNKIADTGSVMSLTKTELAEYYDIQAQLQELIPSLTTSEDAYGQKILTNVSSVEQLNQEYDDLLESREAEIAKNVPAFLEQVNEQYAEQSDVLKTIGELMAENAEAERQIAARAAGSTEVADTTLGEETIKKNEAQIKALAEKNKIDLAQAGRDAASIVLTQYSEVDGKLRQMILNSNITGEFFNLDEAQIRAKIDNIITTLGSIRIKIGGETLDYTGLMAKLETMKGQIGRSISAEQYVEEFNKLGPQIEAELAKIDKTGFGDELLRGWQENMQAFQYTAAEASAIAAETMTSNLESARGAYEKAGQASQEYYEDLQTVNEAEVGSAELQDLILSKYPEWASMMGNKAALSDAFRAAMASEDEMRAQSYINMLLNTSSFVTETGGAYSALMKGLGEAYTGDISNYAELEGAKGKVTSELLNQLNAQWGKYFEQVDGYIVANRDLFMSSVRMGATGFSGPGAAEAAQKWINGSMASLDAAAAAMNVKIDLAQKAVNDFKIDIKIPAFKNFAADLSNIGKAGSKAGKGIDEAAEAAKKAAEDLKAYNEQMKAIQDTTKEVFDFALEYVKWIEEQKRDAIEKTYEDEEKLIEDNFELKEDNIEKEKEGQLEILQIKEDAIKAEQEALDFLQARSELQEKIVDLEYSLAIASLDSSVAGATRRRTIEQQLADERKNLDNLEQERERTLQEEAFARQRAFIEDEATYQQALNETTRTKKLADNQAIHDEAIRLLDIQYSDENNYLLAKQATQSGMIANLAGDMIPLVEAFKQLAIENGEFWTFFGQEDVKNFETSVTTALEAIKKLGFETIQTWKEVASAAGAASSAASANAASAGSGGSGGGSPSPAPAGPAAPNPQVAVNKAFQTWLKGALSTIGYSTLSKSLSVDGSIGPATRSAASTLAQSYRTNATSDALLKTIANGAQITDAMLNKLKSQTIAPVLHPTTAPAVSAQQAITGRPSGGRITQTAYANGGKIDYTGPASVHGTKRRPEYVFNYPQFKDLAKKIAQYELVKPPIQPTGEGVKFTLTVENLINVEGSVDKESLPELKRISNDAITQLTNKLKSWGK